MTRIERLLSHQENNRREKHQIYNILERVPVGTLSVDQDIDNLISGRTNRVIIIGPPGAGKSSFAELISQKAKKKSGGTVQPEISEIYEQAYISAHSEIKDSKECALDKSKFEKKVSDKIIFQLDSQPAHAQIVLLPAYQPDIGISAVEKIAENIKQEKKGWSRTIIIDIAPPPDPELDERISSRIMTHRLVEEYLRVLAMNPVASTISPISQEKTKMECPPESMKDKHVMHTLFVAKWVIKHINDPKWQETRMNIIVPDYLQKNYIKSGDEHLLRTISRYRSNAAYEVYWLYEILKLLPSKAKVIANPQIKP